MDLKRITAEGLGAALAKVERYRLLNQPLLAESICEDILRVDPGNQQALAMMVLALTDQFGQHTNRLARKARGILPKLESEYERFYYAGIVSERQAHEACKSNVPNSDSHAYEWYREAMELYERAEAIRPGGNDDSILRWNTCARQIERHGLKARKEETTPLMLE